MEYPLSPHAGDALLQLAQLEVARGDRPSAITHLERFLLENPKSAERPRTALLLVRLAFEQNEPQAGCVFLSRVLGEVPESDVEVRNQLSYYSPRCAAVDTTRVGQATPDSAAKADSAKAVKAATAAAKAKGKYTLQVAAYTTRAEADGWPNGSRPAASMFASSEPRSSSAFASADTKRARRPRRRRRTSRRRTRSTPS